MRITDMALRAAWSLAASPMHEIFRLAATPCVDDAAEGRLDMHQKSMCQKSLARAI